MSLQLIAAAT